MCDDYERGEAIDMLQDERDEIKRKCERWRIRNAELERQLAERQLSDDRLSTWQLVSRCPECDAPIFRIGKRGICRCHPDRDVRHIYRQLVGAQADLDRAAMAREELLCELTEALSDADKEPAHA